MPSLSSTGDEDVKQLLTTLLRKELIQRPPPYRRGLDIDNHLSKMDHFFKSICVSDSETKISILCTTLEDDVYAELCCQSDYSDLKDYDWICNKLKKIFKKKESDASPLIKLLDIKQKDGQSTREFLSEIRIEGFKLLKNLSVTEREKQLVIAFTEGILNEKISIAVKALQPKNLEAAYKLVKEEELHNKEQNYFSRKIECSDNEIKSECNEKYEDEIKALRNEILLMRKQINSLLSMVVKNKNVNTSSGTRYQQANKPIKNSWQQNNVRCYNCEREGHLARNCTQPIKCKICGMNNHLTKFCRKDKQNRFRFLNDELESQCEDEKSTINSNCSKADFFNFKTKKRVAQKKKYKAKDDEEVVNWLNYIEKNGRRPKPSGKTVISNSHSEKAVNKPIVRGKLAGMNGKIFFDSGSELNLINYDTAQALKNVSKTVKFSGKEYSISCANGSKMNSCGCVTLDVELGGIVSRQEFVMVKNLFPRVFIGIKTMKDMSIKVEPKEECITVHMKKVPFISGVESIAKFEGRKEIKLEQVN